MNQKRPKHPILVVVRGLPGSGKSYLATELVRRIGTDKVVLLDPDTTDYMSKAYKDYSKKIALEGVDQKLHPYRFLRQQAYDAIKDKKIIIWNQPFSNVDIFKKMIKRLYDRAVECETALSVLIVEVEIDPFLARERVAARKQAGGHGPTEGTFARFERDWVSFKDLGFEVLTVSGDKDVADAATRVMNEIAVYN